MANIENINRLIEVFQKDSGIHFRMDGYIEYTPESGIDADKREAPTKYLECQTAMCVAGWANALRMLDEGKDYKKIVAADTDGFMAHFNSEEAACEWLGITYMEGRALFYLESHYGPSKYAFDKIAPEKRKIAGIRVLEILRDTGVVDWDQAIVDAGIAQDGKTIWGWK